jgi:ribosomal protein S18 acetylase RimI-like enzyme
MVEDAAGAARRAQLSDLGLAALVIDDLNPDDLPQIGWSGDPHHLRVVADALQRRRSGESEYLTARLPGGRPVAKVAIDFSRYPGAGYLHQFATDPALQGMGVGTYLLTGAEARIKTRGVAVAQLAVEKENERAAGLYARLGYDAVGEDTEEWGHSAADGTVTMQRFEVILLRKSLN